MPDTKHQMNDEQLNLFLTQETLKLRDEILFLLKQIESNEKFALLSSGAIWALVATMNWNASLKIVIWLPSIITTFLLFKRILLSKTISVLGSYIEQSEKTISELSGTDLGWENYWRSHIFRNKTHGMSFMSLWGKAFWSFLLISNTLIACFFPFQNVLPK